MAGKHLTMIIIAVLRRQQQNIRKICLFHFLTFNRIQNITNFSLFLSHTHHLNNKCFIFFFNEYYCDNAFMSLSFAFQTVVSHFHRSQVRAVCPFFPHFIFNFFFLFAPYFCLHAKARYKHHTTLSNGNSMFKMCLKRIEMNLNTNV